MSTAVIHAHKLSKTIYSASQPIKILRGVDLTVNAGDSVAILGASGSGKSTLLGVLAGLDTVNNGHIQLLGEELTTLNEDQRTALRAGQIGFVFQSFHLLPELSAVENVALTLELFNRSDALNVAYEWLTRLGLAHRAEHYPSQLSGGEQQRVALCRAFAVEPKILFADEPTANLDAHTANNVLDQLFSLLDTSQTSLVVATHDPVLARRCRHRFQLQDGILNSAPKDQESLC
ncbi:ABC transporter ATP-binding protein [Arenicella chitinivorans]|uniref:ABC transporter ATP-binding protein n=1 Tax=Arenicella chitinivorans TaxID=1329800 RepID=A0A918RKB0_9GAMM|nr:ATP-binding cassette domain-containing protein [Arenicella chitinivorans]GHA00368.1 ABC transporter ATP-binding protein [Arenicella chitinivorans]